MLFSAYGQWLQAHLADHKDVSELHCDMRKLFLWINCSSAEMLRLWDVSHSFEFGLSVQFVQNQRWTHYTNSHRCGWMVVLTSPNLSFEHLWSQCSFCALVHVILCIWTMTSGSFGRSQGCVRIALWYEEIISVDQLFWECKAFGICCVLSLVQVPSLYLTQDELTAPTVTDVVEWTFDDRRQHKWSSKHSAKCKALPLLHPLSSQNMWLKKSRKLSFPIPCLCKSFQKCSPTISTCLYCAKHFSLDLFLIPTEKLLLKTC